MKFDLNTSRRDWDDNGTPNHLWDVQLPVQALVSNCESSLLKKDATIKIKITADVSEQSCEKYFLRIINVTNDEWNQFGWTEEDVAIVDSKISHTFNLKLDENANSVPIENIDLSLGYLKEAFDKSMTFSNWKFEIVE